MADCERGLTMLAFNAFDPYVLLSKQDTAAAKPAKDAKVNDVPPATLAGLATLADSEPQYLYEERTAIIEHDSGLPKEWAEAFARMDCCQRPRHIHQKHWQEIVNDTGQLLDRHIHDIIRCGWSIADIFGCHRAVPDLRYDCMGLLILLHDREVVEVRPDGIVIRISTGTTQTFTKSPRNNEAIMIWELNDEGR